MRANQLLTIAVVSTLLIGGMAALGAASPAAEATDNADAYDDAASNSEAPDDAASNGDAAANDTDAHDDSAANGDAPEDRPGVADGVGPSDGLPKQVPGHVSEIHDRIDSFTNGSVDNLGESLSELLGDGEAADDEAVDGEMADDEAADGGTDNADDNAA